MSESVGTAFPARRNRMQDIQLTPDEPSSRCLRDAADSPGASGGHAASLTLFGLLHRRTGVVSYSSRAVVSSPRALRWWNYHSAIHSSAAHRVTSPRQAKLTVCKIRGLGEQAEPPPPPSPPACRLISCNLTRPLVSAQPPPPAPPHRAQPEGADPC